jgi:DNA polymerase-3 subunit beta
MKFAVKTKALAEAVKLCGQVAPQKSPKEILRNVKLHADSDGSITLTATDTEIGIRVRVTTGVEVQKPGSILIPVTKASQILSELTDDSLTIESRDTHVLLNSAHSKFQLLAASVDEFPDVHPELGPKYTSVAIGAFETALIRCVFCTDLDSSRYALGAIHIVEDEETLAVVATDGRRLAVQNVQYTAINDHRFDQGSCLIPERAAKMLLRACSSRSGEVLMRMTLNDVIFDFGDCQLVTRMVEGRYPNWRQVLPKVDEASDANFIVGPLLTAVRQAAIATGPDSKGIDFTFSHNLLKLEAQTADIGASTVELICDCDVPSPVTLKLDHTFVREFLSVLNLDNPCLWKISGANSAVLVSTDDGYRYVIMPMAKERA